MSTTELTLKPGLSAQFGPDTLIHAQGLPKEHKGSKTAKKSSSKTLKGNRLALILLRAVGNWRTYVFARHPQTIRRSIYPGDDSGSHRSSHRHGSPLR